MLGIIHHVNIKQTEYFLEPLVYTKEKLKNTRVLLKWAKKPTKIALAVLDAVRSTFPETNEFIDSTLKEECEKNDNCRGDNFFASKLLFIYMERFGR